MRERQELLRARAVKHEHHQLLDFRAARPHARGDHLAELQARCVLRDRLEIVRIVVLTVDEDDLLGAPGDVEIAAVDEAEIAGAQPAVRGERGGVRRRVLVVAARDVVAAQVHVPDASFGKLAVVVAGDAHAAVRNRPSLGDQLDGILVAVGHRLHCGRRHSCGGG